MELGKHKIGSSGKASDKITFHLHLNDLKKNLHKSLQEKGCHVQTSSNGSELGMFGDHKYSHCY